MRRMGWWLYWSWFDVNRSILTKICAKNDFYIFVPSDLDLWPLDLKFAPVITLVQRCVSTNLEVSTAFLFWENRGHGTDRRTDRQTGAKLNVAPLGTREDCIITLPCTIGLLPPKIDICVTYVLMCWVRKLRNRTDKRMN